MLKDRVEKALETCTGSGLSFVEFDTFKNGNVKVLGDYHCMTEHGHYDGYVRFTITVSEKTFRLTFNKNDKYKAQKYGLREYLDDTIYYALSENKVWL